MAGTVGTESGDASATGPGPRRAIVAMAPAVPGSPYSPPFDQRQGRMPRDLPKRFELLSSRVKALRYAVRLNDFRLAQRLRMGLAAYLRHLEGPLHEDIVRLLEISGSWLRNVGDRHQTKRQIQQIIRSILPLLNVRSRVGS
jgi:hypothetical protein